jgi:hypothetical protein
LHQKGALLLPRNRPAVSAGGAANAALDELAANTARNAPSTIDPMHRFELTTCYRLAHGASGVIRSDMLVNSESPQWVSQVWEINEADIQLTNALYPIAQEAMRRGYYMPNRGSVHCSRHQCPHWRRCEQDFGGVVEA